MKQKLFLIVIFPLLGMLFFSVSSILTKQEQTKELENIKTYLQFSMKASALIHELQIERGLSTGYLGSNQKKFKDEMIAQRLNVDEKYHIYKDFIFVNNLSKHLSINELLINIDTLFITRKKIDKQQTSSDEIIIFFNACNARLIYLISNISILSNDIELSQYLSSYLLLIEAKEYMGIKRAMLNDAFSSGKFKAKHFSDFNTYQTLYDSKIENFRNLTMDEIREEFKSILESSSMQKTLEYQKLIDNKMIKNELLLSMRSVAGYGGLIHDFKNYVLRGDTKYLDRFNLKYEKLLSLMIKYTELKITQEEEKLLNVIKGTFEEYKNNLVKIEELKKANSDIAYIDKIVKVDDTPAILALESLAVGIIGVEVEDWFNVATKLINALSCMENHLANNLVNKVDTLKNNAKRFSYIEKIFMFSLLFISILLSWLLIRGILVKLKALENGLVSFLEYITKREEKFKLLEISGNDEFSSMTKVLNESIEETAEYIAKEIKINRIKDQEKLSKEESRKRYLDTVIETNYNAIIAIDQTGEIKTYNKKAEEIFGWSKKEMIGARSLLKIIPKEYKEMHSHASKKYLSTGISSGALNRVHELKGLRKNGEIFPIRISFGSTFRPEGTIAVANIMDISKEKTQEALSEKLEKEVKKRTKELEVASRAKSDFLANMSHEIRTPLNGIIGFIDILYKDELDKGKQKKLSIIKESGYTLLTVINDILDFSKLDSNKLLIEKKAFKVHDLFLNSVELFLTVANDKGISINLTIDKKLPQISSGDSVRIKQVFSNLLSNAIKFAYENSKIIVNVNYLENLKELSCEVIDSGIGIENDKVKHIFNSFEQADSSTTRRYGGSGLGLSISKALIELMDGHIGVETEISIGSRFFFTLPLHNIVEDIEDNNIEKIHSKTISGKVLIVEDNKTNQMLLEMLLDDLELESDIANDGTEAVKAFKETCYDIILMDENMPIMNGTEATKIIRGLENGADIPIIAVTANALKGDEEKFLKSGMSAYISKPINALKLEAVLRKYL